MNYISSDFGRLPQEGEYADTPPDRVQVADSFGLRWTVLNQAAAVIAALTPGVHTEEATLPAPVGFHAMDGQRRYLLEEGLGDLLAIMEPGVAALLALHRASHDITVPARTLWQELLSARQSLLLLAGAGNHEG